MRRCCADADEVALILKDVGVGVLQGVLVSRGCPQQHFVLPSRLNRACVDPI